MSTTRPYRDELRSAGRWVRATAVVSGVGGVAQRGGCGGDFGVGEWWAGRADDPVAAVVAGMLCGVQLAGQAAERTGGAGSAVVAR
ncbi:MAG: hypothetical protein ACRDS0_30460 [Pseudonocardiaceae bacterium]